MSKKYIKILISISLILIIAIFCFVKFTNVQILDYSESLNLSQNISVEEKEISNQTIESKIKSNSTLEVNVSLKVLDSVYSTKIEEGSSVYDVMIKIKNENTDFDFKYKEYPSLGIFIDEINGMESSPGKYWMYYINNKEASVGVSNYILKDGDSILWVKE
jgi:hypothetical protein